MKQGKSFIPWWRIQYTQTDIDSVTKTILSEHISLGPTTALFEANLAEKLSIPYVVATTSGSMAILMSLIVLGIGPGDEVIIPNRTWIAAAHAVLMLGAKVVLVDVLPYLPIMDISKIEKKITSKTKAIIPTALNGRATNIKAIQQIAKKHNLWVIEDAAQAIFSREDNQWIGTQSDIGCISFSVAKLIPTGQGGCVVTHNKDLYQELIKIRTHGVESLLDCVYNRFGFNFRFTDLQAALGITQLELVDEKINNLNKIYQLYAEGLKHCKKVSIIPSDLSKGELPLYIEITCNHRESLMAYLDSQNIQVKSFYPNINRARYLECNDVFPHADKFEAKGLTLPCGPSQPLENVERVIDAILTYETMDVMENFNA